MVAWADENNLRLYFIAPGKPTQNAFIKYVMTNSETNALNENWFLSIDDARNKVDTWRRDYNGFRSNSSFGNLTPEQFRDQHIENPKSLKLACLVLG